MRSLAFVLSAALMFQAGHAEAGVLRSGKNLCEKLLRSLSPRKSKSDESFQNTKHSLQQITPQVPNSGVLIQAAREENLKKAAAAEEQAQAQAQKLAAAPTPQKIEKSQTRPLFKPRIERREVKFAHLDDLMRAFSQGLIPKLGDEEQMQAYQIYLSTYFGSSTQYQADSFSIQTMEEEYEKHPEFLEQMRFRNAMIEVRAFEPNALPEDLKEATDRILRKAKVNAGKLLNIDANVGFFRKILLDRNGKTLDRVLSKEARTQIADKSVPVATRVNQLYSLLNKENKLLSSLKMDSPGLRQTLVDLIHITAVLDNNSQDLLSSSYSHLRLAGLTRVMQLRDSIAMAQGYDNHFTQALSDNGVSSPSGEERPDEMRILIRKLQEVLEQNHEGEEGHKFKVRQLSIFEKPFRSCVGGSDCSSANYLEFGFDPYVQYFTLTDDLGRSQGQMTLVFGSILVDGVAVAAAFLDKIQNVPNSAILPMMDAINSSISEYGYRLLLPLDPGGHTGISNDDFTADAYKAVFSTLPVLKTLRGFKKTGPDYGYTAYYSRHHKDIELMFYSRAKDSKLEPQLLEADVPWTVDHMNRTGLIQNMMELRKGSWTEKHQFILLMPLIEDMGLSTRKLNMKLAMSWFKNSEAPYRFRSDLLLYAMTEIRRFAQIAPEMRRHMLSFPADERRRLIDRLYQNRHAVSINVNLDLFSLAYDHPEWVRSFTKDWNYIHLRDAGFSLRTYLKPVATYRPHLLVAAEGFLRNMPEGLRARLSEELFLESISVHDEMKRIMADRKFSEAEKIGILKALFQKADGISGFEDFVFAAPKDEVENIRKALLDIPEIRIHYNEHVKSMTEGFGSTRDF